jgi:DNA-binding NarL/FixJ family response regulator
MPRMNGVEATSELRAMMPQVLIVLFTMYYDDAVGRALALSAGANLVVSKPDDGWKLIECVQSLLEAA